MAEMVDMKLPKKSKEELKQECQPCTLGSEQDRWPYGLQLRFETEQVEKLPAMKEYKVGDKISIQATASVTEVRMSETQSTSQDKKVRWTVELQVEQIACEPYVKKPLEKMSMKEYRQARGT